MRLRENIPPIQAETGAKPFALYQAEHRANRFPFNHCSPRSETIVSQTAKTPALT